jgi:uncharacterized protein DUF3592
MVEPPRSPDAGRLHGLRATFRFRVAAFYTAIVAFLAYLAYSTGWPYRGFYGALALLAAGSLVVQYRREHALLPYRLSATGVVTKYEVRGRWSLHLGRGVPVITYQFVAFDQKTYRGETGWGAAGLAVGSQLTILYNPENPAANHPLTSFIFYSFEEPTPGSGTPRSRE